MEQSPKSPKKQVATYVIAAHGAMLTSNLGDQSKKYYAITIPENVELYTHDTLGMCIPMYTTESDFICKNYKDELQQSLTPAFKFIHEHGEFNKFPELFLTPDYSSPFVQFYTGITHCIPESRRTPGSRKKEIIYNIDAKKTKDCECSSIVSNGINLPYDCEKKYSAHYKAQLKAHRRGHKRNNKRNIIYDLNSKCGPILMSEAIKVIKEHCDTHYERNCVIKIYIFTCLVETDLDTLYNYYGYESIEQKILEKVVSTNYVTDLLDFKAIPLMQPLISKHRFSIKSKVFDFITYKDEFIEFTHELLDEVEGPYNERRRQLQEKYRGWDMQVLGYFLQRAIDKIIEEGNGNDIAILPEFNKIDFTSVTTRNATDDKLDKIVYNQLKELIELEKAKNTARGLRKTLRKTLRKKGNKPKKTKHIRRFTHNLTSKKHTKK
jgi:hypothetical protein